MPLYCYKCEACGHEQEVSKPMSKSDTIELCPIDSFVMQRNFPAESQGRKHKPGNWPMESYAAGISPEEIPEFREIDKKGGIPTDYNSDGDPIFRTATHRKKYCQLHELYDRNAGYSDPTPVNR